MAISGASLVAATACTEVVADTSACRKLEYKDGSVARAQYLPCAGEMIAALDDLERQTKAALGGDGQARSDGQATLRRVTALMKAAGGRAAARALGRPRAHQTSTSNISNAVTKYQAFYMVRILDDSNQFAKESRAAATAEY